MQEKSVLIGEDLEKAVRSIDVGWAILPGKGLVRVIETSGFGAGFALVAGIAKIAERQQYDPEITLRRDEVEVTLNSHEAGAVTNSDFTMASAIDDMLA